MKLTTKFKKGLIETIQWFSKTIKNFLKFIIYKMIKLAVIGAGNISHKHLEVVSSLKNFKLVSIYSRTKKSLNVSKKFGIKKVFSSIDKMFDKDNYDAV